MNASAHKRARLEGAPAAPTVTSANKAMACEIAYVTDITPPPSLLEIRAPDDLHLHLRDGDRLRDLLKIPIQFRRAIVMPNLKPPIVTTKLALEYRERIIRALAPCNRGCVLAMCTLILLSTTFVSISSGLNL